MTNLTKISEISKQMMLVAHGSRDTRINDPASSYGGVTMRQILNMVERPQSTEKADAAFVIPSTYRGHDGRNHATQREKGEYWMLAIHHWMICKIQFAR